MLIKIKLQTHKNAGIGEPAPESKSNLADTQVTLASADRSISSFLSTILIACLLASSYNITVSTFRPSLLRSACRVRILTAS